MLRLHSAALAVPLLMAFCAAVLPGAAHAQDAESPLIRDARAFMEAYARDLGAGDRDAVAGRYDRRGAYVVFNGVRDLSDWETIRQQYRTRWQPPAAFEWGELIYEPAGPDAVLVNGLFFWTLAPGREPMRFSYTALLLRQDGELRIRLENEFIVPTAPPAEAPPAEAPPTP